MMGAKQCDQDAGSRERRGVRVPAGGEEREGAGKVYPLHGEMPRDLVGASDRIISGENEQGQLPWSWQKESLAQHPAPPPPASSWRPSL